MAFTGKCDLKQSNLCLNANMHAVNTSSNLCTASLHHASIVGFRWDILAVWKVVLSYWRTLSTKIPYPTIEICMSLCLTSTALLGQPLYHWPDAQTDRGGRGQIGGLHTGSKRGLFYIRSDLFSDSNNGLKNKYPPNKVSSWGKWRHHSWGILED